MVGGQKDIVGLEIAMDEPLGMSRSQGIGNGNADVHGFPPGNRPALDAAAQTLAFEQFGDYVGDPVVVSDVENRQYVGVRERGDSLGFALKARLCLAVVG